MQHTMTMLIAHRQVNAVMKMFDMRPDYKWFTEEVTIRFNTASEINAAYFNNIIAHSKTTRDTEAFWVPAIIYMGNKFVDPEVRILSDGEHEMFITPKSSQPEQSRQG